MTERRRQVALPNYPPILLKPLDWNSDGEIGKCLDALAIHYGFNAPFGGFVTDPKKMTDRWATLALCLLRDFVPAFRERRKGGVRKRDWEGKSLFPRSHEARLVQIVSALRQYLSRQNLPSTNREAFKRLAKILQKQPAPDWEFGRYRSPASFAQAWKAIPREVRENPEQFLPGKADNFLAGRPNSDPTRLGGLFELGLLQEVKLWPALPSIPKGLNG